MTKFQWLSRLDQFPPLIFEYHLSVESGTKLYFLNYLHKDSPSLCSFLSSYLSGRSIAAVVDGHFSTSKPINSSVPQGSVLSPTLFLLFINDLSLINYPICSYVDDTTLYYSMSIDRRPDLQELEISRIDAAERLTSDLSIISNWGRRNLSFLQCLKNYSFIYQLDKIFHTTFL